MPTIFIRFARDESGVTAIEYGLMVGLITLFIIASVRAVGTTIATKFYGSIASHLS